MTSSSSVARSAPASMLARDQGRGLAPDHVEVEVDGHRDVVLAGPDVDVLALAQGEARLVVEAHEAQDLRVREAELRQAVERDPREHEDGVAGVDRLGDPVERPQRGPVAPLAVAVLDVVVDEAEVVAELDGGGARQRGGVLAGDRGVGEEAEERPHPLARGPRAVEAQVVADHLVHAVGRRVAVRDEAEDLRLDVGDERRGGRGRRADGTNGDDSAAAHPPLRRAPGGTVPSCPTAACT